MLRKIFKITVFGLMENAFASKNTLINFYLLAPRQHFPAGYYHHSQAATKITHLPSRQNFLFFFHNLSSQQKGSLGDWDRWLCHFYTMFYKYIDRMNNYHHAFSSLNHCAVTISYTFDILFIKDRRSDIFRKGRIDKGLKYLA